MPYDLVRVKNTSKKDSLAFGNIQRHYELAPGKDVIVPWHLAASLWGDPHLMPSPGNPRARAEEFDRLRAYHGFYLGFDDLETWKLEKCPKVQVSTLDGEVIPMMIHDQFGTMPLPGVDDTQTPAVDASTAELQQVVAKMALQMEAMQKLIEERENPAAVQGAASAGGNANAPVGSDGSIPATPAGSDEIRTDAPRAVGAR